MYGLMMFTYVAALGYYDNYVKMFDTNRIPEFSFKLNTKEKESNNE